MNGILQPHYRAGQLGGAMTRPLTDRETELLHELAAWHRTEKIGARPLDLGAHNGSHHSATLARLVRLGLVERKERAAYQTRKSYRYSLTEAGYAQIGLKKAD